MKNSVSVSNPTYEDLSEVGTRSTNCQTVETAETTRIGVAVTQNGPKKAISLQMVVPTRRSESGSRRTTQVNLTGRQARQLFETLRSFYETRETKEEMSGVEWF